MWNQESLGIIVSEVLNKRVTSESWAEKEHLVCPSRNGSIVITCNLKMDYAKRTAYVQSKLSSDHQRDRGHVCCSRMSLDLLVSMRRRWELPVFQMLSEARETFHFIPDSNSSFDMMSQMEPFNNNSISCQFQPFLSDPERLGSHASHVLLFYFMMSFPCCLMRNTLIHFIEKPKTQVSFFEASFNHE